MALHTALPIYKATFDLLGVVTEMVRSIPREHKASIGGDIRKECLALVILVYRANCAADKAPHLTELLERIQITEVLTRLARDMRLVSTKQYAAVIALTDKVGKQANGWRKSSVAAFSDTAAGVSDAQPALF